MNKFIFDVDGTLTPSRGKINEEFRLWFTNFCIDNDVYLVTGSDYSKTVEQLGQYLCRWPIFIYNCSGSDVWAKGENIRTNKWTLPEAAHKWLSEQLSVSDFSIRTGNHIEERPGMVNFSIVGRNANLEQRQAWLDYEAWNGDRCRIADQFNIMFPDLQATVGGETGIDIAPLGADKSQILVDFNDDDFIVFFGDRMDEGGNDAPLADALFKSYEGTNHWVKDWRQTWEILKNEYSTNGS
jgi:phosphomannomutase